MNKQSIKELIFTGWNFFRVVRLVFSIVIIIQAIMALSLPLGILGALFLVQTFTGPCCATGGCGVPAGKNTAKPGEKVDIVYEEVKK